MENLSYLVQRGCNKTLDIIKSRYQSEKLMPNELTLSKELDVSRTTVRAIVDHLCKQKILEKNGTKKYILRKPKKTDYFDLSNEPSTKEEQFESFFLGLINTGELQPGDRFSELELSKKSGCNTITVREYLIKFSRFGLIIKTPRAQWQMSEFDEAFARELIEFRRILEMSSLSKLLERSDNDPVWEELQKLLDDHKVLLTQPERYQEFPDLDRQLHMVIQNASDNRFVTQFFDIVSFICHYHYQWDRQDEKERNIVAVQEHMDLLTKILARDIHGSIMSLGTHLDTSANTLMRCVYGLHK